jgi:hypothetical protein
MSATKAPHAYKTFFISSQPLDFLRIKMLRLLRTEFCDTSATIREKYSLIVLVVAVSHSQRHGATAAGTSAAHAPSCLTSCSQCFLALALDRLPHTQRFMQNLCCRTHEPTPLSLSPGREKLGRFFAGLRTRFQSRSSIFGWARGLLQSELKAVWPFSQPNPSSPCRNAAIRCCHTGSVCKPCTKTRIRLTLRAC